jgi:hypothetical protein
MRKVSSKAAMRAGVERCAVRGQAPFQEDAAQAHARGAAQHAQEVDDAGALRYVGRAQPAHGADVERGQDEAQADAPDDGPDHQQRNDARRVLQPDGDHQRERGRQQHQADADQPVRGLAVGQAAHGGDADGQHQARGQQHRAHH